MPTDRSDTARPLRLAVTGNTGRLLVALNDALAEERQTVAALRSSLTALVVAAGRMLDGWAEGDDAVKQHLWQQLHAAADQADERHGIYPL